MFRMALCHAGTSRLPVRGPPLDPEGQGDSRKLARNWVQKDKGIHATVGRERQGHSYYDYDYRYHYYDYDYRYHYYDSDYYY